MKLKTEIMDGTVQDHSDRRDDQWWHLEHDAAAAHALVYAMALELPMPHLMAVKEKADEIMREWGYEEARES